MEVSSSRSQKQQWVPPRGLLRGWVAITNHPWRVVVLHCRIIIIIVIVTAAAVVVVVVVLAIQI
jgi:hypothetical protein